MSINIGYFFNSDATLPEVAELFGQVLGCRFEPHQGSDSDFFCRLLSLEASIGAHDLVDDRDLDFSTYRYELNTRTPGGDADLREIQLEFMAMLPSILQLRTGITSGILVYDVQKLLARYEMRNGRFFDVVSGMHIDFPAHVHHVFQRVEKA